MCSIDDNYILDDDMGYRHHIQDANDVLYGYAYNENKQIVCIHDIDVDYRKKHKFYCIHCGGEMIASLKDDYRRKHFRHKNIAECEYKDYLHTLSEHLFKETYDSASTFFLKHQKNLECITQSCKYKNRDCDSMTVPHNVNLKELYPYCDIEKGIKGKDGNNYVADILLKSDKPDVPPLLIEIFYTHECTEQKKMSGLQIAEIKVNSEEDIKNICQAKEIVKGEGVSLYNFNLIERKQLESKILRYVYKREAGSYTTLIPCKEASVVKDDNSSLEMNVIKHNSYVRDKDIEQYINRRYKLEKKCEPSCDISSKNINDRDIEYELIKGVLPQDFKVLIYGPHSFHNRYVVNKWIKYFLKNKIDKEIVVVTGPLSNSSEKLSMNVIGVAKDLSIPYEFKLEDWKNVGKSAAYRCIGELLNEASAVIAFHDGKDNLTSHLIRQAEKRNLPLRIVDLTKDKYICPRCFGELNLKHGRNGLFIACSNYPDCKYTQPFDEQLWQEIIKRRK